MTHSTLLKGILTTTVLTAGLTGCATTSLDKAGEQIKIQVESAKQSIGQSAKQVFGQSAPTYSRFDKQRQAIIISYTCTENANITAEHTSSGHALKVNAPSWNINNQNISFNIDPKSVGSQDGIRYTNTTNPNSLYEWRVKGNNAILSVKIQNDLYRISCQAKAV